MRVDDSAGKGTSGMDKFSSVIDSMNIDRMKLGSKFLVALRIKTQLIKRLQRVIAINSATHSQTDGVEGSGGSLKDGAEAFVLFLHGAQLVHAEVFGACSNYVFLSSCKLTYGLVCGWPRPVSSWSAANLKKPS
jgi:hypothetical protein